MDGSEFQELYRYIATLEKRIAKLEAEMGYVISDEDEQKAIEAISDTYGGADE